MLGQPGVYLSLVLVLLAAVLPAFTSTKLFTVSGFTLGISSSTVHMLLLTYIVGMAAIAWNVIGGFGGQFSLGNGVFMGVSAYTAGILAVTYDVPFVAALALGLVLTLLLAVVIGYPSFQLTGHYFALATITIVEGVRFLTRHFRDLTGGANGFSLIPAGVGDGGDFFLKLNRVVDWDAMGLSPKTGYYWLGLGLFVLAVAWSAHIRYSKLGYYLRALKDDQMAAQAVGIDVPRYKMYGWLVTAFLTGLSGGVYAAYIQYLDPGFMFSITESVRFAVIPIIGGIGTIAGPVIGTLVMVPIQHVAVTELGGKYGALTYVVYGVLLIVLIMYAPNGFRPLIAPYAKKVADAFPEFRVSDQPLPWDEE
ncbi:MAG: branched-chain amino acid ABC transporter permease [Haloarculaceae archaeon]